MEGRNGHDMNPLQWRSAIVKGVSIQAVNRDATVSTSPSHVKVNESTVQLWKSGSDGSSESSVPAP